MPQKRGGVLEKINGEVKDRIQKEVLDTVRKSMSSFVSGVMHSEIDKSKIKQGGKEVDLKEYIKDRVEYCVKEHDISRTIKNIAQKYADSIKERYDVIFASTLIDKMMKAGLLKDDRISSILGE